MSFTVSRNLFIDYSAVVTVVKCDHDAVSIQHLQPLLDATDRVLGVSATYGEKCRLSSIAFSTLSRAVVVNFPARHPSQPKQNAKQRRIARSKSLIQDHLLLNPKFQKHAFKMDQLAVALYWDLSLRINDAVDMLSVTTGHGRQSLDALTNAMGGEATLHKENVRTLFFDTSESPTVEAATGVALQAWAACRAATLPHMSSRFASLPRVDTMAFPKAHLAALAGISRHADRLEALKPTAVKNDIRGEYTVERDAINLVCGRFPTRIRKSNNQVIQIEIKGNGNEAPSRVMGRARQVDGRSANISLNRPVRGNKILSVTTIGKENPTNAESTRQDIILKALQHNTNILANPFFRALWLPEERPVWPEFEREVPPVYFPRLNSSQHAAVERILSDQDDDRIVVIQGPPGTGKTTVIAASVISHYYADSEQNIWVAAQSNVAVKNIAEKFIKEGFHKFKILVSKDFHYDWHEHLYEELESCLIRSDTFKMSTVDASRQLLDCKVILCTLSMFSNPNNVFLRLVPVEMIILDEASQIECGDYLPVLHQFHSTLSKLVFIGDDEQLSPYGQEDIPELRSIFEMSHLRKRALFLDTQYRMPHVIGGFISQIVYGGNNFSPTTVLGPPKHNREEAHVVVKLARLYKSRGMSFRIITPYDGQRSHIENRLKQEELPWEDKVFNVDSFQGNEDDHIIVSVVRSGGPGFLKNQRRTNVMLTRCKQSMVICSSRAFLFGGASKTLIGKLAASLNENWINGNDVVCGRIGFA
ncbi:P-loop containing nucleoside triphosphate hydrolase protein [Boletus coccyginus]|nr:P-loop containing nucleoside triphosphate hydrolase protein [Boletus coccyginus]